MNRLHRAVTPTLLSLAIVALLLAPASLLAQAEKANARRIWQYKGLAALREQD